MSVNRHLPTADAGELASFDATRMEGLLSQPEVPCASIYLPTPPSSGPEARIALAHGLQEAESALADQGLESAAVREVLQGVDGLLDERDLSAVGGASLALFLAPGVRRAYALPAATPLVVAVGRAFHVVPLVGLLADLEKFLVLALGQKATRLYRADRYSIEELDLGGDLSLDAVLGDDWKEGSLQQHSSSPRGATFHGQGSPLDEHKKELFRYCRRIDDHLSRRLHGETPLVVAAVGYVAAIYREASRYPNLIEGCIPGASERAAKLTLRDRGWEIVRDARSGVVEGELARWDRLLGTGKASADLREIVPAAVQGRVDVLLAVDGAWQHGRFDPESGEVTEMDERSGGEDLVNRSAVETLRRGGTVRSVTPEALTSGARIGAILRY